jgi:hypothetical protein
MSAASFTPADAATWDKARQAFAKSIMVDTPIASLAADLDVPPWPITGPEETPAAYIYLPYNQAVAALAARGLPPTQLGQLIAIFNETAAFDQPFGDMMDITAQAPGAIDDDSPLHKNMARLELPADFPLVLSGLSLGTIELCRLEKVDTLGQFVGFASRLSQSVIVGGDFRELLNALAHKDEETLARFLPFRPGAKGLHLLEALALEARSLDAAARAAVAVNPLSAPAAARARVSRLVAWFPAELDALRASSSAGTPTAQLVASLAEATLQPAVAGLLQPHLPPPAAPAVAPKRSFWSRLFGRS